MEKHFPCDSCFHAETCKLRIDYLDLAMELKSMEPTFSGEIKCKYFCEHDMLAAVNNYMRNRKC